ncbi:hypothetical protein HYY75_04245, partial [bacterium]|nr:hypothetical protein [bacterium]
QEAASLTCADLVLNQSLPPPGIWPDQSDKLYLFRERATWIDSGLYYAFLAKSANTNGKALKQFEKDVQLETFLELTRHPTAQNQLPIRPHPLVLKGGIDFTPEVVAILLEKYSYPSQTIQTVKRFLTDRKSETEKVEILK